MAELRLSVNRTIVKGNENVTFTAEYVGMGAGHKVDLMLKGLIDGTAVASGITDVTGRAYLSWKSATQGKFNFVALKSIIPGFSPCGFVCETSNEVSVSVTDAPCDPTDIGCRITPQLDTKLIFAAVAVVIIVLILIMYGPKKR